MRIISWRWLYPFVKCSYESRVSIHDLCSQTVRSPNCSPSVLSLFSTQSLVLLDGVWCAYRFQMHSPSLRGIPRWDVWWCFGLSNPIAFYWCTIHTWPLPLFREPVGRQQCIGCSISRTNPIAFNKSTIHTWLFGPPFTNVRGTCWSPGSSALAVLSQGQIPLHYIGLQSTRDPLVHPLPLFGEPVGGQQCIGCSISRTNPIAFYRSTIHKWPFCPPFAIVRGTYWRAAVHWLFYLKDKSHWIL
jgi:hypothetical protein